MARVYWSRLHLTRVVVDGGRALVQRFRSENGRLVKAEEYEVPVDKAAELIESMRRDVERELASHMCKAAREHLENLAKKHPVVLPECDPDRLPDDR